jgi:hypothetical protein
MEATMRSRFACCSSRFAFSRAARARFVSSLRRANSSVADSNRRVFSASAARWSASASSARAVAAASGARARLPVRLLPRLLRLFLQRPAADHRALLAVERASRLRLLPELVDLPELAVAERRRASSALPRLDRLGGFRNRHRARLLARKLRFVLRARALRARRVLDLRLALGEHVRQQQGRVERLHTLRLVVQHLVGARDLALARLGARRSLGAIDGAARRLLRLRLRRASGFFVLAARLLDTPSDGGAGHEERFVTPTGKTLCQRGSFGADAERVIRRVIRRGERRSFRLVSSRLVSSKWGSVATRVARRSRTSSVFGHRPARASLRALRCARSSSRVSGVMVASRSCAWDGAWLGQGGMTKAETDARWLTGRTRAANPGGAAYLLPHARELARRQNDRTHGGRRSLAPRSRSGMRARLRVSFSGCERDDARKLTQQRECATRNKSVSLKNREFRDEKKSYEYLVTAHSLSHFVNQWL